MDKNPSNNVGGQGSNVDPVTNTPPNVGSSDLNVGQSPLTPEELQKQLAAAQKQLADFQQSNFDLREKERKRKEQEAADKAALEKQLKEQGEYKTLADTLAANLEELKKQVEARDAELARRDFETLRARVAQKHGLAPELSQRLTGQTEAELEADAAALKKLIGEQAQVVRSPGNAPGPKPAGAGSTGNDVDELRTRYRASGKYAF